MFPSLRGLAQIPGSSIVQPSMFNRRVRDPFGPALGGDHHTWNEHTQKRVFRYPQHLGSAWCDYGNDRQGIALEGRHQDFSIMDFFVHLVVEKSRDPVRRTLDLCTVHPRRIRPGEEWSSPPVHIVVHQGDWHVVAARHRDWLRTWVRMPKSAPM